MDKYAALASLYSPDAITDSPELNALLGLNPVTPEERQRWSQEDEEREARLRSQLLGEPSTGAPREAPMQLSGNLKTRADKLAPVYKQVSEELGVPYDLLMAQVQQESGFNSNATSPKGAAGTAQFMPGTWKQYGEGDIRDPVASAWAQGRYMKHLLNKFGGDESLALAGYNAGEGNVAKHGNAIPPFKETQDYVRSIMRNRALYGGDVQAPVQAEQGEQEAQPEVDLSKYDRITLTNNDTAYVQKGMPMEDVVKKLQAQGVEAVPTRQLGKFGDEEFLVPYTMSDEEGIERLRKMRPEFAAQLTDKTGYLAALKEGVLSGSAPVLSGLGGMALRGGQELQQGEEEGSLVGTAGEYLESAGEKLRGWGATAEEKAKGAFRMPSDANWVEKNITYPMTQGAGQLLPYAAAFSAPGGAALGPAALYGGAMGQAEGKAEEVGKPFSPEEATPYAAADTAINMLGLRMLGPLKKAFGPEAAYGPRAFVAGLVEKEGVEGAKAKMGSMVGDVIKGMGVAGSAGVANEIAEDMLFRGYADQDLFSEDAINSYIATAKQAAPISVGMGGVHGAAKQHMKQEELARQEADIDLKAQQEALQQEKAALEIQAGLKAEKLTPEALYEYRNTELAALSAKAPEELTDVEQARMTALGSDSPRAALEDYQAQRALAKRAEMEALPEDIRQEVEALPEEELQGAVKEFLMGKAGLEQPEAPSEVPRPDTYFAGLELPARGKNISYVRNILGQHDIENPKHAPAITAALDSLESSGVPFNPKGMQELRARVDLAQMAPAPEVAPIETQPVPDIDDVEIAPVEAPALTPEVPLAPITPPTTGVTPSAQQIPEAGPLDGGGIPQPQIRGQGRYPTEGGEGIQPSGQEIGSIEAVAPQGAEGLTPERALKESGLAGVEKDKTFLASMGERARNTFTEGRAKPGGQSATDFLWTEFLDAHHGLRTELKDLPTIVDGKLRGDLLYSAKQQLGNVVQEAYHKGYVTLSPDKTLQVTNAPRLAVDKIFKRIAAYKGDSAPLTLFNNMVVGLRAGSIKEADAKTREQAGRWLDLADEMEEHASSLPTTKAKKFLSAATNLRTIAEKNLAAINYDTGRTLVSDEDVRLSRQIWDTHPELRNEANNLYDSLRKDVDLWEDSGLIDADTAKQYRDNPFYIPFYQDKNYESSLSDPFSALDENMAAMGRSAKSVGVIHRQKLHKHQIFVAQNLLRHHAFMASAAAENAARANTLAQMEVLGGATEINQFEAKTAKGVVRFRDKGKDRWFKVHNPQAYEGLSLAYPMLSPLVRQLRSVASAARSMMIVQPTFWYKQLFREPAFASAVSGVGGITPFDAVTELAKILTNTSKGYARIREKGVVGPVDVISDPYAFVKSAEKGKGVVAKGWESIKHIHEAFDSATRAVVYDKAKADALKRGFDADTADVIGVMKARELMNFSRQGRNQTLRNMRATTPFFGAALNSLELLGRAMAPSKLGKLNKADAMEARRMFYSTAATVALYATAYAALMSDDEKYLNHPDRASNWLVPIGGTVDEEHPFMVLPIPFEYGWLTKAIPEALALFNMGAIGKDEASSEAKKSFGDLVVPPMPGVYAVKPIFEAAINMNLHTMRPIERGSEGGLSRYKDQAASDTMKAVIRKLDDMGIPVPSPDKSEYVMNAYFSSLWALIHTATDPTLRPESVGEARGKRAIDLPPLKSILPRDTKDRAVNEFYDIWNKASDVNASMRNAETRYKRDVYQELSGNAEYKELLLTYEALKDAHKAISELSADMDRVKAMTAAEMSAEDKDKKLAAMEKERNAMARAALNNAKRLGTVE